MCGDTNSEKSQKHEIFKGDPDKRGIVVDKKASKRSTQAKRGRIVVEEAVLALYRKAEEDISSQQGGRISPPNS